MKHPMLPLLIRDNTMYYGYVYICQNCHTETPLGYPPDEVHGECEDCGIDICPMCGKNDGGDVICDTCWDARVAQAEEEEELITDDEVNG